MGLFCMKKYENFCRAFENLKSCLEISKPYSIAEQTGIAGLFAICFEQSWKLMKEVLEYHGYFTQKIGSPRIIIKSAYQCGLINEEACWLDILETRNTLAHTYDEEKALAAIEKILTEYIPAFERLKQSIDETWLKA